MARLGLEVAGFDVADGLAGIDDAQVLAAFRPLIAAEIALHLGAPADLEQAGAAIRARLDAPNKNADHHLLKKHHSGAKWQCD